MERGRRGEGETGREGTRVTCKFLAPTRLTAYVLSNMNIELGIGEKRKAVSTHVLLACEGTPDSSLM